MEKYLEGGFSEDAIAKQVANGKAAMPAFGKRLSAEDIDNVAAFVVGASSAGWETYSRR